MKLYLSLKNKSLAHFNFVLVKIALFYCSSQFETEAYLDYCEKMNKLAIDLSEALEKEINSGELEAFIFGMPMR